MAFVASRTVVLTGGAATPLPVATDLGGWGPPFTLYSHMRSPSGGTTYTFDTGQTHAIPGATDVIIAIPVNAQTVTAGATSAVQFGQSL